MNTEAETIKTCRRTLLEARKNIDLLHELAKGHVDEARRVNDIQAAKAKVQSAAVAYEDASAGHVLGDVSAGDLEIARQNKLNAERDYAQFSEDMVQVDAFTAGLMRRLSAAEATVKQAEEADQAAGIRWALAELAAADAAYLQHAIQTAQAARRVFAMRTWLSRSGVATPGRPNSSQDVELPPLGDISLAHVLDQQPHLSGDGTIWFANIAPRLDASAAQAAVVNELAALTADAEAAADTGAGLMSSARRFVRKLAPSNPGEQA